MLHLLLFIIYLAFISLGLPDALLGSAWPSMFTELSVPLSYAGIISMIISAGTIISSLASDRITKKLGTGVVCSASVLMTALSLLGFSISNSFPMLMLFAIPYGLGAGSIDAALNNYVAIHYKSRHMSWLHCMWGVGTIVGPYTMGFALQSSLGWESGYRIVAALQLAIAVVIFAALPLWKKTSKGNSEITEKAKKPLSLIEIFKIRGVLPVLLMFFCYCALEAVAMLWAGSYLVLHNGISADKAASLAGLFFIGLTAGRAVSGFLTFKLSDKAMIRIGASLIALGTLIMIIPLGTPFTLAGLIICGVGCAPVYPCVIHSTPVLFGKERSQAIIGVQMASAYTGTCLMPPLFGILANHVTPALFPYFIGVLLILMIVMHEALQKRTA